MISVSHDDLASWPSGPHGEAAMLMTESLLHSLIAKAILSVADAIEIVDTAISVQEDKVVEYGDPSGTVQKSLVLLNAIGASLRHDLDAVPF